MGAITLIIGHYDNNNYYVVKACHLEAQIFKLHPILADSDDPILLSSAQDMQL
jgi:hypothetical protein